MVSIQRKKLRETHNSESTFRLHPHPRFGPGRSEARRLVEDSLRFGLWSHLLDKCESMTTTIDEMLLDGIFTFEH
jgi:hypothetical protein